MVIKLSKNNKGSGIAVVVYGVVLMMLLIFTAINILNAKIIENGNNSLRDAILAASSGSVMHLLTTQTSGTVSQNAVISNPTNKYDVYLQLALGYIINRKSVNEIEDSKTIGIKTNNFIKLDHKKVVNSTMALLEDAVTRYRSGNVRDGIGNTEKYKILMFFIEPYYDENYDKFFDVIMYHNGMYDMSKTTRWSLDTTQGETKLVVGENMTDMYYNIESCINGWVNDPSILNESQDNFVKFNISLNPNAENDLTKLVRDMETMPYYLIVVKDFSLPTIFGDTQDENNVFRIMFESLSGDGSCTPMCALNAGKTERILKEN